MKRTLLFIFSTLGTLSAFAQWSSGTGTIYPTTITNNVGIGTTSPLAPLNVQGGGVTTGLSNIGTTLTARFNTANPPIVLGVGYVSSDNPFLQAFNSISVIPNSLILNPFGGRIGIGTNSPLGTLDVKLATNQHIQFVSNVNGALAGASGIVAINDANSGYTPLGFYAGGYYFGGGGSVAINTTNANGYMLAVNGSIHSKSIKVDLTGWSDFVFMKDYRLPTLTEVKSYIDKNQHLPDIPSAEEVIREGVDLGEINQLLLKKVEELTLYLIDKDGQVDSQQKQIEELRSRLDELSDQLIPKTK